MPQCFTHDGPMMALYGSSTETPARHTGLGEERTVRQMNIKEPPPRSPLCCGDLDGYNAYADFWVDW